ncbi:aminopeptidase P family protein [Cyclobacterium roseum]|uniref:aminopeptidase P family protein n=1 Tax=Cyclobacterium roseum TaxID=2666137 RepID=UPI001390B139|nr:aminopeptidase P family protein [Cyclobacterium roseum]
MHLFSTETYIERRKNLKKIMKGGVLLFLGNEESSSNFKDNWYPFRQDSSFLYFFGLDVPGLAAVIDIDEDKEIIFGDELTTEQLVWHGDQPKLADLARAVGVAQTLPWKEAATYLAKASHRKIHYLPPYRPENCLKLMHWFHLHIDQLPLQVSEEFIKAVARLRSIKSEEEMVEITKAVNQTVQLHRKVMQLARPGMYEYELLGLVNGEALAGGGGLSFPPIITINGQTLHNHHYGNKLEEGRLLLADFGTESAMHYAGDITRTFPVGKQFSASQREIYEVVWNAHRAAIEALKPGVRFLDIHLLACKQLVEGLKTLGLMKGDVEEAVQQGAHALFFPCGLGHLMGLDVHDMEDLGEAIVGYTDELKKSSQFGLKSLRLGKELAKGQVLTVEPGIYFIPQLMDSWQAQNRCKDFIDYEKLEKYRTFGGIRIEDDFLITADGSRILGEPLETSPREVESLR